MKEIVLGRIEGTQPFEIKTSQTAVSGKHAKIVVDDAGCWWIEDSWSTNGTYIRDEVGYFRKVGDKNNPGKCRINPKTFIKLSTDNAKGCCFYARQVVDYGDYDKDFEIIKEQSDIITSAIEEQNRKTRLKRTILRFLPALITVILFLKDYIQNGTLSAEGVMLKILVPALGNPLIELFFHSFDRKKKLREKSLTTAKKNISLCPNPCCSHILSETEVDIMKCNTCNVRHS